jgi:hypothetical protein
MIVTTIPAYPQSRMQNHLHILLADDDREICRPPGDPA